MKNINDINNNEDFKPEIDLTPGDQDVGVGEDLRPEIEKPGIGNDQWPDTQKEDQMPDNETETPWQNS